jgi:hypothetical protein
VAVVRQASRFKPEEKMDRKFGVHDNYSAVNEYLSGSDHSAIFGTFLLQVKDVMPRPVTEKVSNSLSSFLRHSLACSSFVFLFSWFVLVRVIATTMSD